MPNNGKFISSFDESCLTTMEEFNKRYLHTWLFINDNYYYYQQEAFAGEEVKLIFSNLSEKIVVDTFNDLSIDVKMPPFGYFNHAECSQALLFLRKPVRQFKRGISYGENCYVETFLDGHISGNLSRKLPKGTRCLADPNSPKLSVIFKDALLGNYVSNLDQALFSLQKRYSTAMSPLFVVCRPLVRGDDRPVLFMLKNIVGFINTFNKTIEVEKNFIQEVLDLVKGTQWKIV